ncbi:MAG: ABC transporter permease, partial [Anaerovoracaceae bacterium]
VCVGLCIRQSASNAEKSALSDLSVTAQISPDRSKAMDQASNGSGSVDRSKLKSAMGSSLTLTQLQKYAKADAVKSFYYTLSTSLNASGSLEAYSSGSSSDSSSSSSVSTTSTSSTDATTSATSKSDSSQGGSGGGSGGGPGDMNTGDFQVTGYSSDEAMTDFVDGKCEITDGKMFDEGTSDMVCVISNELAEYNDLSVGDTITLSNPSKSSEKYKLKIVGIYKNSQSSSEAQGPQMTDPANEIYMSYNTLNTIVEKSASKNGKSSSSRITGRLNGTYVVGTVSGYNAFKKQVKKLGLSSKYTVTSSDIEAYERSAQPLNNLAKYAGYFLIVILAVGAVILVVMNIFSTRERKYEIGVLLAIGMKKSRVAKIFVTEILIITLAGVIAGGAVGTAVSVPVTKALLSSQITQQQEQSDDMHQAFGRENNGAGPGAQQSGQDQSQSDSSSSQASTASVSQTSSSSSSASTAVTASSSSSDSQAQQAPDQSVSSINISNAMDLKVLLELLASCILLAIAAGAVSVVAIMRYEPMQILANRD